MRTDPSRVALGSMTIQDVAGGFTVVCTGVSLQKVPERTFAIGFQFHPEAAAVKHMNNADNKDDFMDYDTALAPFRWLLEEVSQLMEDAA